MNSFKSNSSTLLLAAFGLLAVALLPKTSFSQANTDGSRNFGFGFMLGEPTGVSVKSWLGQQSAFDIGAAWSLAGRNEALHLHADYLFHSWFQNRENLALYYGLGGRIIFSDDATAGVRVPIGLNYVFDSIPFDLFVEAVPILDVNPDVELAGNGAVGIRYYF